MFKLLRKYPLMMPALIVFVGAIIGQAGYDLYEAFAEGRIYLANHGHERWITFADAPLRFTADIVFAAVPLVLVGWILLLTIKWGWRHLWPRQ